MGVVAVAGLLALAPVSSTVYAATSAVTTNNTATKNDLLNADIIDESKTGSISIYKYDITAAEAAGDYKAGTYKATGEADSRVESALKDYAIEGVQFSYLRVGNVETHSVQEDTGTTIELVYEIPTELAKILGLTGKDNVDMTGEKEANPCHNTGVYHVTSQKIADAMEALLKEDNVAAKNALESYLYDYGTEDSTTDQKTKAGVVNLPKTDKNGYTHAEDLQLGLYLFVETEVPEQVVETVNPWFVQLPFTNTSAQTSEDGVSYGSNGSHAEDGVTNSESADGTQAHESGGESWLYDMVVYPKNQTGNPTLDKSVRNAYSNTISEASGAASKTDKNMTVHTGSDYISRNDSDSLVVFNKDTNAKNTEDINAEKYVANRGGYTADGVTAGKGGAGYSEDFAYRDTTTASEGDVLDYILVSKLPHISSKATFLSEYTFTDTLSKGISYNRDLKIAFYNNAEDANANNTKNAVLLWNLSSGDYSQEYVDVTVQDPDTGAVTTDGSTCLKLSFTEAGLNVINGTGTNNPEGADDLDGLSDYYMVAYYTATVHSDDSVVLGDEGNPNDVNLVWSRTSDGYYNMLEDKNYVYSYGLDLTKTFSDKKGHYENVQFKLYNASDAYYVVAEPSETEDGVYYVTGKTTDETKATTFIPNAETGKILVNGTEADEYQLTEVATDDGYNLLKDQIVVDITATDRDVIASVAGVTGMDAEAAAEIVKNYHGGIYDENGNLVTNQLDELLQVAAGAPNSEVVNGRTIGKTDLYVGAIKPASATVDKKDAAMTEDNAKVLLTVNNTKGFLLPQTGGKGLYLVTIIGVVAVAGGCYLVTRKRELHINLKQKWLKRVAAILLILGGIGLVGYPWISDWCYRVHTQSSVAVYAAEAKEQSDVTEELMQNAIAYNAWLSEAHITLSDPFTGTQIVEKPELPYASQLALDDSGIFAFVEIPKLHVYLPVYHTTSAEVLQRGAGHMEGTALPVGGAGNRPVISAHSGMNWAQMFSDLSDLETGDLFLIHVLDETLTYQVCDMAVILPEDTQALVPEKDRDLVSLVTCTPYGINTHRLVVTGERTDETASEHKTEDRVRSTWRHAYLKALLLGFGIAGGAGVMIRILSRHRQKVREQ